MTTAIFKLVTIICEPVLSSKILELAKQKGATGFTITEVRGEGNGEKSSGEIPDLKSKIEIISDSDSAGKIMNELAAQFFQNYGLIVYSTEVSVLRPGKFKK